MPKVRINTLVHTQVIKYNSGSTPKFLAGNSEKQVQNKAKVTSSYP